MLREHFEQSKHSKSKSNMEGSIIDNGIRADSEVFDSELGLAKFTMCAFDEFGERYLTAVVKLGDGAAKHRFVSERYGTDEYVTLVDLYARSWNRKDTENTVWNADTIPQCHALFSKMIMAMAKMYGVHTLHVYPKSRIGIDKGGFDVYKRYIERKLNAMMTVGGVNTDRLMYLFFEEDDE
jgi:hypothetical protein